MKPTPQQAAIIAETRAKILVLAGAGSGKTRTLIWRIEADIQRGTDPQAMVAITFTNRAARILTSRLEAIGIKLGFVGTLHAYALHQVNRNRHALGYLGPITIIDEEAAAKLRKATLKDLALPASTSLTAIDAAIGTGAKDNAGIAAKGYLRALRRLNMADFTTLLADLEVLTTRGMIETPSALYVDEYQDSGERDERIYNALRAKIDLRVGDADQSMYSFRGGKIENILRIASGAGWAQHHLSANYRSARAIVDYANKIIAGNPSNGRIAMEATTDRLGLVEITSYPNDLVEAMSIAAFIKAGQRPASDYAILTRYNDRAANLRKLIASEGIPTATIKHAEQPKRLIAALHALQTPDSDRDSLAWVTSIDIQGINSEAGKTGATLTATLLRRLRVDPTEPLGASLQKMGLQSHEIAQVRDAWAGDYYQTITALQLAETETADDGVHVGTVHSFKGGEKPVVFYAGIEAHTTPGKRSQPEIEEERRILYVAITRGMEEVRLSWCQRAPDSIGRFTIDGERSPLLQ